MNKKNLLKMAAFLDKLPREKFDLRIMRDHQPHKECQNTGHCGTVGCAMGWSPTVFPDKVRLRTHKYNNGEFSFEFYLPGNTYPSGFGDIARELFDITIEEAYHLFASPEDGYRLPWRHRKPYSNNPHPKTVANSIRKFIEWKENGGQLEDDGYIDEDY